VSDGLGRPSPWRGRSARTGCSRPSSPALHEPSSTRAAAARHVRCWPRPKAIASRRKDLHRLDLLTLTEAELVARDGRQAQAWELASGAARGLVSVRHDGTLWVTCHRLARLAADAAEAADDAVAWVLDLAADRTPA
jgi:hypothetical protein